ncbi:histidine kinase [Streptomyces sp. I05A-00742]|uniref:sensor histidine kinase n=1 Tax=Streptomyces sp. I05A-00742 TaxID=2732853 RepID=UPI00289EF653|nr:histidine kinase [Streptomyces sp. I05A-00742]
MTRGSRPGPRAVLSRRARLRWVHLLIGGALVMPYFLLANVLLSLVRHGGGNNLFLSPVTQITTFAGALPLAALSALLFPLIRPLESTTARALCGIPEGELATGPARTLAERGRPALYFTLHLMLGGLVSGMSLAAPPAAVALCLMPLMNPEAPGRQPWFEVLGGPLLPLLAPLAGLALLALLAVTSWAAGGLLARCAPALLGPTASDRLAAAERRAQELAMRNRLARELHDSVGHALSAVLLQASAARRVLGSDPEFARQALTAIEETTRDAVGELDTVLGLLREDGPASAAPAPTLADLDTLLDRTRAAGGTVVLTAPEGLASLPPVVSREAYRIVQEGLSNALRHAGPVPVRLCVTTDTETLEVTVENPVGHTPARTRGGGGRGLNGIAERARLLRGSSTAGARDGVWRLSVRLPLSGGAR